ncbi:hypothetical protein AB0J63_26510 [Streptosporangium canum]|uniref:hypothetical protein n=1 Tax=Streptosporangium canum TaxID=324952 RepID=UPI003419BB9F
MPLPQPEGFEDRFLALERKVNDLFTSIQNSGGFTTASQGLIFPDQATPAAPASGGHLHANGSQPYWRNASGDIALIQNFPQGDAVSDPASPTAGSAPGSYSAAHSEALRTSQQALYTTLLALVHSLRGEGIIAPF